VSSLSASITRNPYFSAYSSPLFEPSFINRMAKLTTRIS
jgi:hypothetical protein